MSRGRRDDQAAHHRLRGRLDHGLYRGIYSSMVDDAVQFQVLTPEARLTLMVLRVCRDAGTACIFRYYPEVLQAQTGLPARRLAAALAELSRTPDEARPWIFHDERARVVWIRNGLRRDPGISLSNPRQFTGVMRAIQGLPATHLAVKFRRYYGITKAMEEAMAKAMGKPSAPPSAPTRARSESESESETETEIETPNPSPTPSPRATRPEGLSPNGHSDSDGRTGRPGPDWQEPEETRLAREAAMAQIKRLIDAK